MKPDPLKNLRIASPCPMKWEQMTGDERTRFCSLCDLHVYNIAELTRKQVSSLISATEGRICGRIYRRADGTVITKDCPVGLRAIRRRVARSAGAVFATLMTLGSAVFGQKPAKKEECRQQVTIAREKSAGGDSVSGTVVDANGALVAGAKIKFIDRTSKTPYDLTSSDEGKFKIALPAGAYDVTVTSPWFKTIELPNLVIADNEQLTLTIILVPASTSQPVLVGIIAVEPLIDTSKPGTTTIFSGDLIRKLPIP